MKKLTVSIILTALLTIALITAMAVPTAGKTITIGSQGCNYTSLTSPMLVASLKDGDVIQIQGTVSATALPANGAKHVTITGDTLDLTGVGSTVGFNGNVTLENITVNVADNTTLYANGYKIVIGEGVSFNKTLAAIYGGGASGTTVESTDLTVLSGNFLRIYGGSNGGTVSGDTNLTVGDNANSSCTWTDHSSTYCIYGGGNGDEIGGSTHLILTGEAKANYIYGGSTGTASTIAGAKHSTMSGGCVMSYYGGNHNVNTGTNVYATLEGGTLQQLFGGNESAAMTGNVDLRVLGGTVQRRIYGGCYNEWEITWKSSYYVTGNITVTIGGKANITFEYDDSDRSIYASSRQKTEQDTGTLIFADATAASAYQSKLGSQDGTMALIMESTKTYTSLHRHTFTASGAVITQNCDQGCAAATATLSLTEEGPFTYNGKAYTPAYSITYSGEWLGYEPTVSYIDNTNVGTAFAVATTLDGQSASVSFTVVDEAIPAAPVLTANAETVRGKADGTVTGLTTDMEWSTDGTSYVPVTDADMTFAAGTYYVRYAETDNCSQSAATAVTVDAGAPLTVICRINGAVTKTFEIDWNGTLSKGDLPDIPAKEGYTQTAPYWDVTDAQLTGIQTDLTIEAVYTQNRYSITLPSGQAGYTVTADSGAVLHGNTCTVTFTLSKGFGKTDGFAVKVNGTAVTLSESGQYTFTVTDHAAVTVEGVADLTPPTVSVQVGSDSFDADSASGTDHYYAVGTTVTAIATDMGEGVLKTEYLFSDTALTSEQLANAVWILYEEPLALPLNTPKHLYVKATDGAGNIVCLSTPRLGIDQTPPVIPELKSIDTVYGDLLFTATDVSAVTVTVDGRVTQKFGNSYTVVADNAIHTIIVTDAVGNETAYTVTVYRTYTVTFWQDGSVYTTKTVGHGLELTDVPAPPAKTGHTVAWSNTDFTNVTADMTATAIYTPITYTVTLPQSTVGYTVSATGSTVYGSTYTVKLTLAPGYSKTADFALRLNGTAVVLTGSSHTFTVEGDMTVTVEGVADITPPLAQIHVGSTYLSSSLQSQSTDKYFNAAATATVDTSDSGTGVRECLYCFSAAFLTEDDLDAVMWLPYTEALALNIDVPQFLYVRITDNADNIALISTARLNVDAAAPVISGFTNGGTVYGALSFTVSDALAVTVSLDGRMLEKTGDFYTVAADNAEHTVTVTDAVGNEAVYTVTVYRIYTVSFMNGSDVYATRSVKHGQDLTDFPAPPTIGGYTTTWETVTFTCVQEDLTVALVKTPVQCAVTYPPSSVGCSMTASHGSQIPYGTVLSFSVTVSDGYTKTADFAVKINGEPITPSNGNTYRVTVTGDITVTVAGIADVTAPAIIGFSNGSTVYGDLSFTVTDVLDITVEMDGSTVAKAGDFYTVSADNGTHTVKATDAAGNTVTYTVTVYRIYTVVFKADGKSVAERSVNHGQALTDIPDIPQKSGYTATAPVWSVTSFDAITSDMTVNAVYTADPTEEAPSLADGENTASDSENDQIDTSGTGKSAVEDNDSSTAIVIVIVVAGISVAAGGSVLGVLLYKKKKR